MTPAQIFPPASAKLPLLVFYTQSHEGLRSDFFLPSFQKHLESDFYLVEATGEQSCPSGVYFSQDWHKVTSAKLSALRRAMDVLPNEPVLFYSDVDVVFTQSPKALLLEGLQGCDIALQLDRQFCSGLFVFRNNPSMRNLLDTAIADCHDDDQRALNRAIAKLKIAANGLPASFYSVYRVIKGPLWIGERIDWPEPAPVGFHANFVLGLGAKRILLDYFVSHYERQRLFALLVHLRRGVFYLRSRLHLLFRKVRNRIQRSWRATSRRLNH